MRCLPIQKFEIPDVLHIFCIGIRPESSNRLLYADRSVETLERLECGFEYFLGWLGTGSFGGFRTRSEIAAAGPGVSNAYASKH